MSKKCKNCWKLNPNILNKYCSYSCDNRPKKIYSVPKKIWRKKIERLKNWWSEAKVFEKVNEENKLCRITGKYITEPASFTFPHILAKSKYLANVRLSIWPPQLNDKNNPTHYHTKQRL